MVAGHSGQFTPGGYLSTVIHTALAGIEPKNFLLLVRRATGRATETTKIPTCLNSILQTDIVNFAVHRDT